jgi:multiple sugar transport system permease protein
LRQDVRARALARLRRRDSADVAAAGAAFRPRSAGCESGALMTLVVPVILFVIFQRVFIRGIVITGVEK